MSASIHRLPFAESDRLRFRWPIEWKDGEHVGLKGESVGGSYPPLFHSWPLARRNAWFGGFCVGRRVRLGNAT